MSNFELPVEIINHIQKSIKKYPAGREQAAVKSVLMAVQKHYGYLTVQAMDAVAAQLNMPPMSVYEIAHFYSLYRLKPCGKNELAICTNVSCWLRGAEDLLKYASELLDVQPGETSEKYSITLKEVECLAACGQAPAAQINGRYIGPLDKEKLLAWIKECD